MYTILIISYRYSLFDFKDEDMYMMNLTFNFCLETGGDCNISISVWNNVKMPKKVCHWTEDYKVKGNENFISETNCKM